MRNMGNMVGMMQKAQKMQKNMAKMQEDLKGMEFEGEASSGMVKVEMKGDGTAISVEINDDLIVKEDKDDLQDLIVVAINDVKEKIESYTEAETKKIMGDLNLPAGFKLPF